MTPLPPSASGRRLTVDADLDVTVDGHPVAVRGEGTRLTIAVDDSRTAFRLFQANRPGRKLVRAVTDTLEQFGIDVEVTVGGRSVLAAGPSAQAGRLATAIGLEAVEITPPPEARYLALGAAFLTGLVLGIRR